jgi:hypothetical protein
MNARYFIFILSVLGRKLDLFFTFMEGNALCFNRKQLTYKKLIAISGEKDPFFYNKNNRIILILTKILCIYLRAH